MNHPKMTKKSIKGLRLYKSMINKLIWEFTTNKYKMEKACASTPFKKIIENTIKVHNQFVISSNLRIVRQV